MNEHAFSITLRLPTDIASTLASEAARLHTTVHTVAMGYLTGGAMAARIQAHDLTEN